MHDPNREQRNPNTSDGREDALALEQVSGTMARHRDQEGETRPGERSGDAPDANAGTGGSGHDPGLTGDAIPMDSDAKPETRRGGA